MSKYVIECSQCGVRLSVSKNASSYTCPACNHVNDVAERIKSKEIGQEDKLVSLIKYEGDEDTLVWKHPIEDFNYGTQLIVHESQEAIFFKDGQALDMFGSGRYTLETQQLPLLEKIFKLPTNTEHTFHSEIYYINLATVMGIKWGTDSKVRMFDPVSGLHVELGASGEFNIRVINSRKLLLKLVGTKEQFSQEQIFGEGNSKSYFRAMIMTQVKSYLAQAIKECGISILEIDEKLMLLSNHLKEKLNGYLDEYGLQIPEFFVSRVITPDDDPNFRKMKEQYAENYLRIREEQIKKGEAEAAAARKEVEATTAARMKVIGAQGEAEALKVRAQAEAESYKMQAEAEAAEMRLKGYSYQQETSRQVGLEAMKNGLVGEAGVGAGALGDLAGLGVGIGAMSGVIGMTKDAMAPMMDAGAQIGQNLESTIIGSEEQGKDAAPGKGFWDCSCGQKGIVGNFCSNCGAKKPEPIKLDIWDCSCGATGMVGNFCSNCGKKRGE